MRTIRPAAPALIRWMRAIALASTAFLALFQPLAAPAAGGAWTANGPYGGPIRSIAVDPVSSDTIYAAGYGGVFKSFNRGLSWTPANDGFSYENDPFLLMTSIAVDPTHPETLYAGALDGIYKSTNAGASWSAAGAALIGSRVDAIAIDPTTPSRIYVAANDGIYRSADGGASWVKSAAGLDGKKPYAIAVAPTTPATVYAGTTGGVFKSVDGGVTWAAANTGFNGALGLFTSGVVVDPQTPTTVYAAPNGSVYRSVDGGGHWTPADGKGGHGLLLALDPRSPGTLYASDYPGGVSRTTNGGTSWTPVNAGLGIVDVSALAVDPQAGGTVFVGTEGGIFRSLDGGTRWVETNTGLSNLNVLAVAVDPLTPTTIYAGTRNRGVFKSTDGGGSWASAAKGLLDTGYSSNWIRSLAIDPVTPGTVYAGTNSHVYKSVNGGATWALAETDIAYFNIASLAIDPAQPANLVAGTLKGGVYRSSNAGANWKPATAGMPASATILGLSYGATSPPSLWAAVDAPSGDRVMNSTDGGATWSSAYPGFNPEAGLVSAINFLHNTARVGALTLGSDESFRPPYPPPFPTTVGVDLADCLPITTLVGDPNVASESYVAARCGVLKGTNHGAQLTAMNAGLPRGPTVNALALTPGGNALFAGVNGGSVYAYSLDGAPLSANYQGLWWNAPPGSESGWGINFAHQGDTIFATWFTYGADGKPLWLIAVLQKTAPNLYAGPVSTVTGPAFNAVPFDPNAVVDKVVGTMTVGFVDSNHASFAYTVNGIAQTKSITRQTFASPVPTCVWGAQSDLAAATNFQDMWWNAPPGSESGWGVNFTHQGDTIFATWFTYGADGKPLWLIAVLRQGAPKVYSGPVSTVSGPAFDAVPFDPGKVVDTEVGSMTVTFADGNHATFAYTVNGIAQSKAITRQVFAPPGTLCR